MPSTSHVRWEGSLTGGKGHIETGSGTVSADYTTAGRFEGAGGTNPEELIAAAHAACYTMALSHGLAQAGNPPEELRATASVSFRTGEGITGSHIDVRGRVPGIDQGTFEEAAAAAAAGCPVPKGARRGRDHAYGHARVVGARETRGQVLQANRFEPGLRLFDRKT